MTKLDTSSAWSQLYDCTIFYSRRVPADLLSHQRDQEDQQSQDHHVTLAFLPRPEVQSLPGSLVDPRHQTSKSQYAQNLILPAITPHYI